MPQSPYRANEASSSNECNHTLSGEVATLVAQKLIGSSAQRLSDNGIRTASLAVVTGQVVHGCRRLIGGSRPCAVWGRVVL